MWSNKELEIWVFTPWFTNFKLSFEQQTTRDLSTTSQTHIWAHSRRANLWNFFTHPSIFPHNFTILTNNWDRFYLGLWSTPYKKYLSQRKRQINKLRKCARFSYLFRLLNFIQSEVYSILHKEESNVFQRTPLKMTICRNACGNNDDCYDKCFDITSN